MNKTFIYCLFVLFTTFAFALTACSEKDLYEPGENPEENDNPSLLDYSTSKELKLVLSYDVPLGYSAPFQVYAENPYVTTGEYPVLRSDIKPIAGGIAVSGRYEQSKEVPAYVTDLYVLSGSLFAPTLMHAKVQGDVAAFKTANLAVGTRAAGANVVTRGVRSDLPDFYLGQYGDRVDVDANHRPNYIDESKTTTISANIFQRIDETFVNNQKPTADYAGNASIELTEEAEIWVSVIVSDGTFRDALSYFCYDGPKADLATLSEEAKGELKEIVAFPAARLNTKEAEFSLKAGEYVQLKYYNKATGALQDKFPAGTTVGWMLRATSYDAGKQELISGILTDYNPLTDIYYSVPEWNPEKLLEDRNHTIIFNAGTDSDPFICFGFEDWHNTTAPYNDGDCNDVMFHVMTNPSTAVDPPVEIPDSKDDVTTTDSRYGMLAFEDYWPLKWDYDMNDVVVKYTSAVTLLKKAGEDDVYATEINDVYTLLHTGADFDNKFSLKVDMNPNLVSAVTVNGTAQTISADGSGFIIDIFENAREEIVPYKEGQSKDFEVKIELKSPGILQADFNCHAPYNPFISPINPKAVTHPALEVHLPMYKPSGRADLSYFGTGDDHSDPAKGLYYVSDATNKYPFAIHLSGVDKFKITEEGKAISTAYPRFINWVESGLTQDLDWYVID